MFKLPGIVFGYLCLALTGLSQAADHESLQLPDWQVLEFEQKAYWATAQSRLEILAVPEDHARWELNVLSSVVDNSEQLLVNFDAATCRVYTNSRLSRGKDQRLKSYDYKTDFIMRERRNPGAAPDMPPQEWPLSYSGKVVYPESMGDAVVTTPYLLVLLAQRLQAQGPDKSMEVIVHTDLNFYRVRLTSGNGIPIDVDYDVTGQGRVSGSRETLAVALHVAPEGTLADDTDFSLLGLQGEIILFFDRSSGLPLQIRGIAPRIGATAINLKSVTLRESRQ